MADDIKYIINEASGDNGELRPGDDIKKDIRETMAKYVYDKSKKNSQRLTSGLSDVSLSEADGTPKEIVTNGAGSENPFASSQENHQLEMYSDSGNFENLSDIVKKGKAKGSGKDGNSLLKDIESNGLNKSGIIDTSTPKSKVVKETLKMLIKKNKNDPSDKTPYIRDAQDGVVATRQLSFGSYDPNATEIKFDSLRKVADSLMLKAAGEFIDGDPDDIITSTTLIPGQAQLGIKIRSNTMRTPNAYGAPNKPTLLDIATSDGRFGDVSYGNLNTPSQNFAGMMPIAMTSLGLALAVASQLALLLIGNLLGAAVTSSDSTSVPTILPKGKHRDSSNKDGGLLDSALSGFADLIGLKKTKHDFNDAFTEGLTVFLGPDAASVNRLLNSPGYYVIFFREIIRSGEALVDTISNINFSNPIDAVQGLLGIIDMLRSSKMIAAINIYAIIGDLALSLNSNEFKNEMKDIDNISLKGNNPFVNIVKSREDKNKAGLVWRNSSVPSAIILPESVIMADGLLNDYMGPTYSIWGDKASRGVPKISTVRLKPEDVQEFEAKLDAEYVPFYFHDLRTNEIIAFHAFLDSLNDSYKPNWESVGGYGRIDQVKIYKDTTRSLSLTFNLVATSPEDFDVMWMKFNKLITMLYPQWSPGTIMKGESDKFFTQPFSQTISASPLIRLRVGDVIRSNYSKFNLARIFGLGSNSVVDADFAQLKKNQDIITNVTFGTYEYSVGEKVFVSPGYYTLSSDNPGIDLLALSMLTKKEAQGRLHLTRPEEGIIKSVFKDSNEMHGYKIELSTGQTNIDVLGKENIILDVKGLKTIESDDTDIADTVNFFKSENNSIVRSFESMQGKGLAGCITSLSTEWVGENVTWETEKFGGRAPKIFKVQISFDAIHDITPGLDNDGYNRAPIYPVGNNARRMQGKHDGYDEGKGQEAFNNSRKTFGKK